MTPIKEREVEKFRMIVDRYSPFMSSTVFDTVTRFLGRFTSDPIDASSSTIDIGLDSIHLSELEFELQRVCSFAVPRDNN